MNAPAQRPISDVHIRFCATEEWAHSAFDEIIDDAQGGIVAIDIETIPNQSEIDRLAKLRLERAEAIGRLKAEAKLKRPVGPSKGEIKRLNAAIGNAASAGLDPHRARIRLLQLWRRNARRRDRH
jgi:hypothetical protein